MAMPTLQTSEMAVSQKLSTHSVRPLAKRTTPQRNAFLQPMQQTDRLLGIEDRWKKSKPKTGLTDLYIWKCSGCGPSFKLRTPRRHPETSSHRPETAKTTGLSTIIEVVRQQPPETPVNHQKLDNKHTDCASNTNQPTQELENKQISDVVNQTSPPKGFQLQSFGTAAEHFGEKSGNEQVSFPDNSNSCPTDIQKSREYIMTTPDGDSFKSPLKSTAPHIEEKVVRDEQADKFYLPLSSTVVLKRKPQLVCVHLDFDNNLIIDALLESRAYVSAIVRMSWTQQNKKPRTTSSKSTTLPIFKYK